MVLGGCVFVAVTGVKELWFYILWFYVVVFCCCFMWLRFNYIIVREGAILLYVTAVGIKP